MNMIEEWAKSLASGTVDFILPFLILLSILVFVHEWGHYIVARLCGVRVEQFAIGFGPEIFGRNDSHGTRWKICAIPLGGYVKMYGDTDPASAGHSEDEVDPAHRDEAFFAKPVGQRAAVVFAGPAINFIFALILLTGMYATMGKPVIAPTASAVLSGGAADIAGIQPGDKITSINGKVVRSFSDIQRRVTVALDAPMTMKLVRNGEEVQLDGILPTVRIVEDRFGFEHSRGLLGIIGPGMGVSPERLVQINDQDVREASTDEKIQILSQLRDEVITVSYKNGKTSEQTVHLRLSSKNNSQLFDPETKIEDAVLNFDKGLQVMSEPMGMGEAVIESMRETGDVIASTFKALGQIFSGERSARELGGIIRIGAVAGDAAQSGIVAFISFMALLSINLGLINLFPIPLLDGGHLMFYAAEAVRGKPVSEKVQDIALRFGLVILIGIMLFANVNDLVQLIL